MEFISVVSSYEGRCKMADEGPDKTPELPQITLLPTPSFESILLTPFPLSSKDDGYFIVFFFIYLSSFCSNIIFII